MFGRTSQVLWPIHAHGETQTANDIEKGDKTTGMPRINLSRKI
jgi:hypothetical protein